MDHNIRRDWTTAEIIYVSVGGVLICMAFAEIIAFTGSLTYSFVKVHLKAKAAKLRGVQYLSLIVMVIFWVLRILFLGAMFSLVPVPHWQGMATQPEENHEFLPSWVIIASQYLAFSLVALLLLMPTFISIQQLMTSPSNVKEQIDAIRTTSTFPRVLIVMPVYNELPEILHVAICSAIDGDYPKEHLHIFISFDNHAVSDLYRALIRNLGVPSDGDYYPPVLDLYFRGVQITVSRFPHGGKRLTQKKTFGLINSIYKEYPEKTDHLFVLFIDSDILLHPSTIANFVWDMQLRKNNTDMLAMTGVITVTTKEDMSFINLLQDIEYVHGQFIGRAVESAVGGCVTLPGALTIFRYSAFLNVYDEYFAERTVSDLWDFGRSHLGEDRYLTHLLMSRASRPKMIQFCHRATCKTEPVREWRNLMKQRRRWFLGFLTNEGAFLSDPHLWAKYPWLLAFRLIQDIVNGTSMVSYVTIVGIATGMQHWSIIWLALLAAYFLINWAMMFTYGFWLGRYKAMLYPLMFTIGPFVTWFLLVYGVITANERTWGGPRADAAADTKKDEQDLEGGHGGQDGDGSLNHDGSERPPREEVDEFFDPNNMEQIELPDHLFDPQQQQRYEANTCQNQTSEKDGGNVHGLVLDHKVDNSATGHASGSNAAPLPMPGKDGKISFVGDKFAMTFLGEEWVDDSDDDAWSGAYAAGEDCEDAEDYFGVQPLSFASNQFLGNDAQWWDDDKHLASLGILPFVMQPKIPAAFSSTETLVLTPVIPGTPRPKPRTATLDTRSVPGTPRRRPESPFELSGPFPDLADLAMPSPAFSAPHSRPRSAQSISSATTPVAMPSPTPSFRYVPVKFITPTNSAPSSPRMSPVILPTRQSSMPSPPASINSSPPVSSPPAALPYSSPSSSRSSISSIHRVASRVPTDVLAAAQAIASLNSRPNSSSQGSPTTASLSVKRKSSLANELKPQDAAPPVPVVPFPPPPTLILDKANRCNTGTSAVPSSSK
ncbi:hypothetical protein BGX28_009305 [Mortierella sp. GBA30]|nr:hypothetical protein BGX28_009305 [Mortierella sp. GBA30]